MDTRPTKSTRSERMRRQSLRVLALSLLGFAAAGVTGCADGASSSTHVAARTNDAWSEPVKSRIATGTATGDAGYGHLHLPPLPDRASVESGPEPMTRNDIFLEQMSLDRVFLTERTLKRVLAPAISRPFIDDETGEKCFPALGCYHPDCPGRGADGEPYAYIIESKGAYLSPSGQIVNRTPNLLGHVCPVCIEVRDLSKETEADRRQFQRWIRPHELPETAGEFAELNAERRRRIVWDQIQREK